MGKIEKARQASREWHARNRERSRENSKRYYQNNAERLKQAQKDRRKSDPKYHSDREKIRRMRYPERFMFKRAKKRAIEKGLDFNIDLSDIIIPEICPVYPHITLDLVSPDPDNSPSLDRIDNTQGYIKGNIRVISGRANRHKSDATLEELQLQLNALTVSKAHSVPGVRVKRQ